MSSIGARHIFELLDALKETARNLAVREERLNQGFAVEQVKLRQRLKESTAEHNDWFEAELAAANATYTSEKQRVESRHSRWKTRATAAGNTVRQRRNAEVEAGESRRKFEIQRDLLQSSRTQESGPKDLETQHQEFVAALAAAEEQLTRLQKRAQGAFRGYGLYRRMLSALPEGEGVDVTKDQHQLLEAAQTLLADTRRRINGASFSPILFLFRLLPIWLLVPLIVLGHVLVTPAIHPFNHGPFPYLDVSISLAISLVVVFALYFLGRTISKASAVAIVTTLARARRMLNVCVEKSTLSYQSELDRTQREGGGRTSSLNDQWKDVAREAARLRTEAGMQIDARTMSIIARSEKILGESLKRFDQEQDARVADLKRQLELRLAEMQKAAAEAEQKVEAENQARWQAMISEWTGQLQEFQAAVRAAQEFTAKWFPAWSAELCRNWQPPEQFAHAAKFGVMDVDFPKLVGKLPLDPRLAFTGPSQFQVPLLLSLPQEGSVLFETRSTGHDPVMGALNNLVLRLLSVAPPGRIKLTIIDPVELGQNFAGVMHLADFEDSLISNRIWTQPAQIEQQLADLNEHIEKVTQMYLRNEYESITEYNEKAGRIAEKYRFLVVADFPANFTELAVKRLMSIVSSGPRCGVYTLLHWDQRRPVPTELVPDELRNNCICVPARNDGFAMSDKVVEGITVTLDAPPPPELATELLQHVGKASVDSNRVEMPFAEVAPPLAEVWTGDTSSELRVAIGRTGATKLQYLALGRGTRQHVLIAGKTGSGKSTLFHVMITNLALWFSPEQVEFYLVDFKKGVEFKCYANSRLPHARVVAIESDREFGLSVLQRVDDELRRRGDLFRELGVQDVAGYKKAGGKEPMPRTLLIIDEFQEFFVEDDRVSQGASLLLDRLVRQGRAFGIHVLLGSQTLGGAYTLARPTLGQMVVRIALQCNEADAYLIMDENNPAPRLLSRPGEAIYNDAAGSLEGNSPFQVVWLPDEVRESYLDQARQKADQSGTTYPGPIVFEGNAPAHIEENTLLRGLLAAPVAPPALPRIWMGAPNSIKGPTEIIFQRQSGNNLLIVGQRDESALAILVASLFSLAAQYPRGAVRLIVFDNNPPDSAQRQYLERVVRTLPQDVTLVRNENLETVLGGLTAELEKRANDPSLADAPPTFLFIHGLQRFKKLRYDENLEYSTDASKTENPAMQFARIVAEGPGHGVHVLCSCDSVSNLNRLLNRKTLGEFDLRVLFQMGANDSALLIDSPKAGNLGLHRALFFDEQEGYLETFRPYALPNDDWMQEAVRKLARSPG